MKIKVYKDLPTFLCLLTLYCVMFSGFFTHNFGITQSVFYIPDLIIFLLLIIELPKINKVIFRGCLKGPSLCVLAVLVIGFTSDLVYGGSISRILWAIRNWGRFFSYFLVCICVLDQQRIDRVVEFYLRFIHINFGCIIFQFLFLHSFYTQDELNGFLGRNTSAVNLIYCAIVSILAIAAFKSKRLSKVQTMVIFGEIVIISILAELKANILFVALFFVLGIVATGKFTAKKIIKSVGAVILACIVTLVAMNILVYFYPGFKDILTINGLWEMMAGEKGYGNSGYINRLTSISVINKYFFDSRGFFSKLFGIGIGNAEYSKFPMFTSVFYNAYGEQFCYMGFSSAALYLEVGFLGLIFFGLFHVCLTNATYIKIRNSVNNDVFYYIIGFLTAIFGFILIIYNNIHRTDVSIILAFFLAIPFAIERRK